MAGSKCSTGQSDIKLTIDGQTWAAVGLGAGEQDQFQRSICPQCGAWEKWAGDGVHYVCTQCGTQFFGEKDNVYKLLGQMDERGNVVTDSGTVSGSQLETLKNLDSPFYEFLTAVDPANRDHWMKKFKRFQEGRFTLSWNWPSYFFGPWRYFTKGMSVKAVLYIVPLILGTGLIDTASVSRVAVINILGMATSIFYGLMGSKDYYRFCRKYRQDIAGAKKAKKMGKVNLVLFIFGPLLLAVMMVLSGGY